MEVKVPYRVTINLLPQKYIARRTPNWIRLLFVIVLLGFSVLYLFSYGVLDFKVKSLTQEVANLKLQVNRLREEERRLKGIQDEVTKIEKRVALLKSLIQKEKDWLRVFVVFGENMPQDLALLDMRCSPERVECRGKAGSVTSIAEFIGSLSQYSELFNSVDFTSLALGEDNLYEFGLLMELKGS